MVLPHDSDGADGSDGAAPSGGATPRWGVEAQGQGEERELVLAKNGQRFVFRCAPGDEPAILDRLGDLVRDPDIDLDWFDAAVLSHQVGQRLGLRLQRMHTAKR